MTSASLIALGSAFIQQARQAIIWNLTILTDLPWRKAPSWLSKILSGDGFFCLCDLGVMPVLLRAAFVQISRTRRALCNQPGQNAKPPFARHLWDQGRGSGEDTLHVLLQQLILLLSAAFWAQNKFSLQDKGLRSVNTQVFFVQHSKKTTYRQRRKKKTARGQKEQRPHIHIDWTAAARSEKSLVLTSSKRKIIFKQKDCTSCISASQKKAAFEFTDQYLT